MERGQALLQVLGWRLIILHVYLVSETILTQRVRLKPVALCLVCYPLLVLVLSLESHGHLVNRKCTSKEPKSRKDKVNPC